MLGPDSFKQCKVAKVFFGSNLSPIFSADDWQFYWVSREWMNSSFDKHKFKENQLVCHFRNDYELTRKDCLIKNHKKAKKAAGPGNQALLDYLPASYVLPVSSDTYPRRRNPLSFWSLNIIYLWRNFERLRSSTQCGLWSPSRGHREKEYFYSENSKKLLNRKRFAWFHNKLVVHSISEG